MHMIKRSLEGHEDIIRSGLKSFVEVGQSLAAIRDEKLYPGRFSTFEHYLKETFDLSRSRAYQFITSAKVAKNLSTIVDARRANEAQFREVARASEDPEIQRRVWEQAAKESDGKPTAATIKKVAATVVASENRKSGKAEPPKVEKPPAAPPRPIQAEEDPPDPDPSTVLPLDEALAELDAALNELRKQWPPEELQTMADKLIVYGRKLEKEISR